MNLGAFNNRLYRCRDDHASEAIDERMAVLCQPKKMAFELQYIIITCCVVIAMSLCIICYLCLRIRYQQINQLRDISEAQAH